MITDPLQTSHQPSQGWWCVRSDLDGRYATRFVGVLDGHLTFDGPVQSFFDQDDAERAAVEMRETYPALLFRAIPLPPTPPVVCRPRSHKAGEPIAAQLYITTNTESVWLELRPETACASLTMFSLLQAFLELAGERISGARVSPLRMITLGEQAAQVELRRPSNTEAA